MTIKRWSCWLDDKNVFGCDCGGSKEKKRIRRELFRRYPRKKEAAYNDVIHVLDRFKASGITRFGLATERGKTDE
ncbi:MAG: hypothetical protein ACLUIQ_03575 [Dialister invisus]